jgi:hypothetical protein
MGVFNGQPLEPAGKLIASQELPVQGDDFV